jgi:Nucleotidyl transferase AbiEii toxin, Type IV TA system
MPLSPLQDLISRIALGLPEARTLALAGGAAMIAHGFVSRLTQDVDLFTEVDDREAVLVASALRTSLEQHGLETTSADRPPLDHRFVAVDPTTAEECLVEVFADGGRLRQRVTLDIGAVLHPDDLAADKVLALWGRARPRDFFDVHALLERFGSARLLELASAKDRGFSPATFLDALNAIKRLTPEDWAEDGIDADVIENLRAAFATWHHELAVAEPG